MTYLRKHLGRRWRGPRLLGMTAVVLLGYLAALTPIARHGWLISPQDSLPHAFAHRHTRSVEGAKNGSADKNSTEKNSTEEKPDPLFPEDLFSRKQRQHGAVLLHVVGLVYMFVALAIVCDEFFVPSLDVIIERLNIVEDVAGATFMAAGGSAPELFTSVIGVFVSFDNVGVGTIVGSAVFNILFVIGMCSLFSHGVLQLTWWPLFRDVTFYSLSLIVLILCFLDSKIYWYEALILLFIYSSYVIFMKWNFKVEQLVKKHLYKNKVARVSSADQLVSGEGRVSHTPVIHAGSKFRHGLLHLMISSIDPMHDGSSPTGVVDEKATQNHAIASLKVLLDATKTPGTTAGTPTDSDYGKPSFSPQGTDGHAQAASALESGDSGQYSQETEMSHLSSSRKNSNGNPDDSTPAMTGVREASRIIRVGRRKSSLDLLAKRKASVDAVTQSNSLNHVIAEADGAAATTVLGGTLNEEGNLDTRSEAQIEEDEGEHEALDLSWPETTRKRISYVLLAPITIPLWLTLPDTRRQEKKKYFPLAFIGSIVWIAIYSYLMVWWASVTGDTLGVPNEVMGLTFLAAGTSIPDLITSVIVARKGLGDMAVSSSIGSNIFDVTVGLPFPWLLYCIIYPKTPVVVDSAGMACSIVILFAMLLFVIMTIACFKWRMNKTLGCIMFALYFVFLAISLLFEYKWLKCPI